MHAARLSDSARLKRVHALLVDGAERSTLEIVAHARVCAVNSCIAELRANGAAIDCRQEHTTSGRRWYYRMTRPAPEASEGTRDVSPEGPATSDT